MPEETLLDWANNQPDWARDALRRHAAPRALSLSDSDKVEILQRVRHHSGLSVAPPPICEPISECDLAGAVGSHGRQAILCSLGPVEHLNRLARNQRLRFAIQGLTLVYGDNGSGKSGYTRIAKNFCRSLTSADLLGNVFEAGAKPPASVEIRYRLAGDQQVTETTWTSGDPAPQDLCNISVFDTHNARLYVDQENRISYLPTEIALLQRHGEHCSEMDAAFQKEIANIEKRFKVPLPSGYSQGGNLVQLLARLDPKMKRPLPEAAEVTAAGAWTDLDASELQRLEKSLANDPAALAARCRRVRAALENIVRSIRAIEAALTATTALKLEDLRAKEKLRSEAATLAAMDQFAREPFAEVGLSAWRHMYDYAKAYVASIHGGSDRLPDGVGDRCVLCQEPLSQEGSVRVRSFNEFVGSEATKAADTARELYDDAINTINAVPIPTYAQASQALAEYAAIDDVRKGLSNIVIDYCVAANACRDGLLKATTPQEFVAVLSLPKSPLMDITAEIAAIDNEAHAFDLAAKDDSGRIVERHSVAALRDREKLFNDLPTVLARRDDLEQIAKLKACCMTVERAHISRQITALRKSLVMQDLERRILDEIHALDLTHIPFAVNNRSKDGQSYYGVAVESTSTVVNSKVLSEGEQRALALACFLAENESDAGKHCLIIDDPVSSLDHMRLRRVAIRLVEKARAGRQIIVFTHSILFFNEAMDAASRTNPPVPVLKNFIRSSKAEGFGMISEADEPWIMLSVAKRIEILNMRLKGLQTSSDFNTDDWRSRTKDFYTDLRETWERLVEEVLLGKVVERFNTDVRTQSLKNVVVEDTDYGTIYWAMKKVSERSGHDMAMGKAAPVPTPAEMKADLDELDQFRSAAVSRRNKTAEQRKKLEQPPAAEVA